MNDAQAHDVHGDHEADVEDDGVHATTGGYLTGFVLAVILTVIPFWLVMGKVIPSAGWTMTVILALGAVQIVVHMIYFLHMTPKAESGWSLMGLVFTTVLVVITLSGSLWIMFHLRDNMMPMPAQQTRSVR